MPNVPGGVPQHFLHPCTIFAHRQEHWVCTVLGSCVSVCLWDPQLSLGGMNHFMLPLWNGEGLPTPKYGNVAVDKLLEKMLAMGARKERLVAKVFGGANLLVKELGPLRIGEKNIAMAQALLANHAIRVETTEVGGRLGMRIHFNTASGSVRFVRLHPGNPVAPPRHSPR